jgi:hypothetical protein
MRREWGCGYFHHPMLFTERDVDFLSSSHAPRLDGVIHNDQARKADNAERTRHVVALGIQVQFANRRVFEEPGAVLVATAAYFSSY